MTNNLFVRLSATFARLNDSVEIRFFSDKLKKTV